MESEGITGQILQEIPPKFPLLISFRFPAEECFDRLLELFLTSSVNFFENCIVQHPCEQFLRLCDIVARSFYPHRSPLTKELRMLIPKMQQHVSFGTVIERTAVSWANIVTSAVYINIQRFRLGTSSRAERILGHPIHSWSSHADDNKENVPTASMLAHITSRTSRQVFKTSKVETRKPLSLLYESPNSKARLPDIVHKIREK
jgi:hypothetical protein